MPDELNELPPGAVCGPEIDGMDFINGTTVWRVKYEFADADGGGYQFDYFKTRNRYTPPTGDQVLDSLNSTRLTVIGIESIEWHCTDLPDETFSLDFDMPTDSAHKRLYDLIGDGPPSARPRPAGVMVMTATAEDLDDPGLTCPTCGSGEPRVVRVKPYLRGFFRGYACRVCGRPFHTVERITADGHLPPAAEADPGETV